MSNTTSITASLALSRDMLSHFYHLYLHITFTIKTA